jgi:uncharacterized protein (DUF2235 family)
MSRNLVLCFDGTDNQFGYENTNVVRLVQSLDRDPTKQRLYYDPGIGTLPEPGFVTPIWKRLNELCGLAFGAGLTWKVSEAYSYLMDLWEPGDQVYLFGFSRGSYTARVLAGLLHTLGLLPKGNQNLVPYALRLFRSIRKATAPNGADEHSHLWDLCDAFRWTFAKQVSATDDSRRFPVHFLGLWDTVASVGWVWEPERFPFTYRNPSVHAIRHAVSIDERRWFFRQNLMERTEDQDFKEQWFPGVHSDVGGGYTERDGGVWREPFRWILQEATAQGMFVDPGRLNKVLHEPPPHPHAWADPIHESLHGLWWLAEFFPKLVWHPGSSTRWPEVGRGRHRFVHAGATMHRSTLQRVREASYSPPNLSPVFLANVRKLDVVPESMDYEP